MSCRDEDADGALSSGEALGGAEGVLTNGEAFADADAVLINVEAFVGDLGGGFADGVLSCALDDTGTFIGFSFRTTGGSGFPKFKAFKDSVLDFIISILSYNKAVVLAVGLLCPFGTLFLDLKKI